MTRRQIHLRKLIREVAKTEGTESKNALRDLLTDLRHVADNLGIGIWFDELVVVSMEVYLDECEQQAAFFVL